MPEVITKDEAKTMMEIVDGIRKKAEEAGTDSAAFKSYMEKSEADLGKLQAKNEEMIASIAESEKKELELKERLEHLENTAASVVATPGSDVSAKAALSFVGHWAKGDLSAHMAKNEREALGVINAYKEMSLREVDGEGQKMAQIMEAKAATDILRSDIGEVGGLLCPPEYSNEMNKNIIEHAPLRRFVNVRRVSSKTYKEWVRVGIPRATWVGETREDQSGVSNFAEVDFSPQRLSHTTPITTDQMLFSAVDMAQYIMDDTAMAFAVAEGEAFFDGSGLSGNQPLGFTQDPNVPEFETATTTLTFDDFRNIIGELKRGYKPYFFFNRRTLSYLLTLKDGSDRYLWNPPYGDAAGGAPATIAGTPYSADFIEFDDFDVSGGFPVLLADMKMFYQMTDRTDMNVIRDEYTRKREAIVEYTHNKWTYGAPKIKEAGIRMKRQA